MAELSDDEVSLQSLFEPAKKLISDIEDGAYSTSQIQAQLKTGIENLQKVTKLVNQLRLFSSNEQIEDVPTSSLPYLLTPCFLGIFHQNLMVDTSLKLDELRKSKIYLRSFLNRLRDLCLISTRLPWEDEDTEDANPVKEKPKLAVEEIRRLKLERHKKKQELKMSELRIKKQLEAVSIDEQNLRDLYITQLLFWSERSYEELQAIEDELPLLKMMAGRVAQPNLHPALSEPLKTVPALKPFIITRDAQQRQVFGLGYPGVPVMSVDEWYHQKFGCNPENAPQSSAPQPEQHLESEEEDDDEARAKAMRWDIYKDDHRRGWGNTHNKG
ncbi:CBN-PPFR-4 protein [Caenorhabditis brenneri]|uniref:CBN-PPFR-4 protein n=1 Tax=Caenorhabditis brenneri TaxID=135651 RepID=G0MKM6_CAEBE|nr:CBN-PPFR-4 protein [Caenorhabditis brenneri]